MSDWASKRARAGGILWLLCIQYFVAEQIARFAWPMPYSMSRNYISDLGAVRCLAGTNPGCSPLHALMNSSFVLQGILIFFGGILLWRLFPRGKLNNVALTLITISGIGVFLVGLAPEDVNPGLHYAAAAEHFLCDNVGMALLGVALLFSGRQKRTFSGFTLLSGAVGLIATLLLSWKVLLGFGVGTIERVASYPFTIWLSVTGLLLIVDANCLHLQREGNS